MALISFSDFQFLKTKREHSNTIPLKQRRSRFVEIYKPIKAELVAKQADRCLDCGNPYCEWKCPVHNYIPNWLDLLKENRIIEAAELCHETNSLPEICGRICPQDRLCEQACTLNDGFGAVTIGDAEKYIVDTAFDMGWRPDLSKVVPTNKKVAVVGAGPAGLACADILIRKGVAVTVFDRYPEIGGLLTFGIPAFKLEKKLMIRRREIYENMGVVFKMNCEVGKEVLFKDLQSEYDAVFLGLGTYDAIDGDLYNAQAKNMYMALPYLIGNVNKMMKFKGDVPYVNLKNKKVVVLGGGDTAMDCNRTAIRQGAKSVHCVYRRDQQNMPGSKREIKHAMEEGVEFLFQKQPLELLYKNNAVTGVRLASTHMSQKDTDGRVGITVDKTQVSELAVDAAIIAFGFNPSPPEWLLQAGVDADAKKRIEVSHAGPESYDFETSVGGVFAGGDMVRGADLVVTAIWEGRKAAEGILARLEV